MDPSNPVVELCIRGMQAEARGEQEQARQLYSDAWDRHASPAEGMVAAHYVARLQSSPGDAHGWNRRALDLAFRLEPETVRDLLPSLHLNLGRTYEDLELLGLARDQYERADHASHALADDGYGRMTKAGIAAALDRSGRSHGP